MVIMLFVLRDTARLHVRRVACLICAITDLCSVDSGRRRLMSWHNHTARTWGVFFHDPCRRPDATVHACVRPVSSFRTILSTPSTFLIDKATLRPRNSRREPRLIHHWPPQVAPRHLASSSDSSASLCSCAPFTLLQLSPRQNQYLPITIGRSVVFV